jgi:DNA-binding transcriptional LysR family regulator
MQWDERIGRRLKLRDLHILLAVMEHGSMAKAASALAISQPAVSKAIADLEYTLGLRLLDRARHGMAPTAYGRALITRGLTVFDELRQAVEDLKFLADPTAGELRIGSSEAMAAGFLPAVIDRLSRQYPRVTSNVAQAVFAAMQYRELRERSIDLLLGRVFTPFKEGDLAVEILFDDQVAVVVGAQSPWARSRRIKLADLLDESWILPPADSVPGSLVVEIFRASGLDVPRAPLTTLSIHLCLRMLATGRYVTTRPRSILHFSGKDSSLKVLPIKLPAQPRPVGIVTLKNRTLSPVARLFIDCAREVTKPLVKGHSSAVI